MPDVWPHFVCGAYIGNLCRDIFHIAYTHTLGGVDVPFGFYEICPTSAVDNNCYKTISQSDSDIKNLLTLSLM